jgi:hypothetical protein
MLPWKGEEGGDAGDEDEEDEDDADDETRGGGRTRVKVSERASLCKK